jgi:Ca-activated chloride channel family protein
MRKISGKRGIYRNEGLAGNLSGWVLMFMLLFLAVGVQAQNERKVIRQGIKSYENGQYDEAETQFRKAADLNHSSFEAGFNTGAALYNQEKYPETVQQYEDLVGRAKSPAELAQVWHNMGNSLLEGQQYAKSIQAYRNSLRLNPSDMDTKYNLAYAMQKLQDQQQQQNKNQDQDQQDKNQEQKNQNQDQQNKDQDQQQQQEQQAQQDQQQQQKAQQKEGDKEQQQAQPYQISKEDAERMLAAIQQQEKNVMDKVEKKKAAVAKVKTKKDW